MKVFSHCDAIREHLTTYKQQTIALVPTMGNLHEGHSSLIELANTLTDHTVVSIFVNPTQFNQASDYENYPRTIENDLSKLASLNVDAVFTPTQDELYPNGIIDNVKIIIPNLTTILEGEFRPGHFEGVCTVVSKLFNIISPNVAVFGEKDYQQLLVIQHLVDGLSFNTQIIPAKTSRETSGLAMSSRNTHLSDSERQQAGHIFTTLKHIQDQFSTSNVLELESTASQLLTQYGFKVEYFAIRDAANLQAVTQSTDNIVILTAVWLGATRLIDNILFPKP